MDFKNIDATRWVKDTKSAYDFDVKKADKIFDLSLERKQLKLQANNMIASTRELKGKKYCKFHNASNHYTNECKVFCLHIQQAIEQGKIKFELAKKLAMDIDGHPFLVVHMVEFQLAKGKTKFLKLAMAKEDGSVDPKVQILVNEYKMAKQ